MKQKTEIKKSNLKFKSMPMMALQDSELSYSARGIYCYVMSKPSGWKGQIFDLVDKSNKDTKYQVRKAIKELVVLGYAKLRKVRKEDNSSYLGSYYEFYNEKIF